MCDYFGGVGTGEEALQQQEQGLAGTMTADFNQQYSQQQASLQQLNNEIGRIQSGNTGPGFGGAENAARISQIQNVGAAAARNAIQAQRSVGAGSQVSAQGGLTRQSGINQQTAGQIEERAGAGTSNALLQEQAENYATGRANAISTAQALQTMANSYNPLGYGNAASSANSSAFSQAQTIEQQKQQKAQAIGNLAAQVGITAATGGIGGLAGGAGMGGGLTGFLKAGLNSLGANFQPPPPGGGGGGGGAWNLPQSPDAGGLDYSSLFSGGGGGGDVFGGAGF